MKKFKINNIKSNCNKYINKMKTTKRIPYKNTVQNIIANKSKK